MKKMKTALMVGVGVSTIGLAGLSGANLVSAATTSTTSSGETSIVDKIASKFGLDKAKVQAVFDEERESRIADMKTERAEALKQAVTDKKITQDQADHITSAWKEIDDLRGTTKPSDESDTTRQQIRDKMDELHDWLDEQNIDLKDIGGFGRHGGPGGMHGGPRGGDR